MKLVEAFPRQGISIRTWAARMDDVDREGNCEHLFNTDADYSTQFCPGGWDCSDICGDIDLCSVISSNATMSDLPGPGRTLGYAFSRFGRALENMMNDWANRRGLDPNAIAESMRLWCGEEEPKRTRKMLGLCNRLKKCLFNGITSTQVLALESLASLAIEFPSLRKCCRRLLISDELEALIESTESTFETLDDHLYFYALGNFILETLGTEETGVDEGNAYAQKFCFPACEVCLAFLKLSSLAQRYRSGHQFTSRLLELRLAVWNRISTHHAIRRYNYEEHNHGAVDCRSNLSLGSGPQMYDSDEFKPFDVKERLKALERDFVVPRSATVRLYFQGEIRMLRGVMGCGRHNEHLAWRNTQKYTPHFHHSVSYEILGFHNSEFVFAGPAARPI